MAIMTTLTSNLTDASDPFSLDGGFTPTPDLMGRHDDLECLCPFCGAFNATVGKPCSNCQTEDNSASRAAVRQRGGRWFVLQTNQQNAPGMSFDELQSLVQQNRVTSRSVVRGPGTSHLWRLASKVRGLSREFRLCYSCGGEIETFETNCPHCDRSQAHPQEAADASTSAAKKPITAKINSTQSSMPMPKPPQPAVHVHTLSEPTGKDELQSLLRPVIAEQYERHIPKDDLLTPRDVAKAFQLEFGANDEQANRYFEKAGTARKLKVLFISTISIAVAAAIIWPMIHLIPAWLPLPAPASVAITHDTDSPVHAAIASSFFADARPAGAQIPVFPPAPIPEPTHLSEAHTVASGDPIIVPDPSPSTSPADDPTALWNTGLDAESTGNFGKAVEAYERIESLPSYQWPTHLETRLELARKELKGEAKP
jgi:hypothetical protein